MFPLQHKTRTSIIHDCKLLVQDTSSRYNVLCNARIRQHSEGNRIPDSVIIVLMILTPPSCQFSYLTIVCKFTFSKFSVCFKGSNTKNVNKTIHYSCRQLLFCRSINLVSTLTICSSMKLYALLLISTYVKKCTLLNLHLLGVVIYVLCR